MHGIADGKLADLQTEVMRFFSVDLVAFQCTQLPSRSAFTNYSDEASSFAIRRPGLDRSKLLGCGQTIVEIMVLFDLMNTSKLHHSVLSFL